jgi:Protein of unknown function (DUF664)
MEPRYTRAVPESKLMMLDFLDARRQGVLGAVGGMPYEAMTSSNLPSGWTPLGMLTHLIFMERRWLVWGFKAEAVREPQADRGADHRFRVPNGWGYLELSALYASQAARTRAIVEAADLSDKAATGGWFATPEEAPTLGWILLHVLGEYGQHAGQLDVVAELLSEPDSRWRRGSPTGH